MKHLFIIILITGMIITSSIATNAGINIIKDYVAYHNEEIQDI